MPASSRDGLGRVVSRNTSAVVTSPTDTDDTRDKAPVKMFCGSANEPAATMMMV